MALEKIYTPIGWQNKPSTATPLGSHNLSKIDEALAEIDTRVVELSKSTDGLDKRVEEAEADITKNTADITTLENRFTGFSVATSQGMEHLDNRVTEAETKITKNTEDIDALKIVPTASGSPVYIKDASNMGFEGIDFLGESKQLQTTGKNLYPEYSVKSYTSKNTNALAIGGGSELGRLEPNTTYYIAFKGTVGNTYCLTTSFTAQTMITVREGVNVITGTTKDTTGTGYNTVILNNYQNNEPHNFSDVMVMKVNEPTPYEPYTGRKASPSPDYPRPIEGKVVNGVDVSGKNLLQNTAKTQTVNGVTFTINDDKSIKTSGSKTGTSNVICNIGTFTAKAGIEYICSYLAPDDAEVADNYMQLHTADFSIIRFVTKISTLSFEEDTVLNVRMIVDSTTGKTYYPMIRLASITDATYEPHQSQTVNLSAPIELNGFGGVRDTDKLKKFGVVVFDGSDDESWVFNELSQRLMIEGLSIKRTSNNNEIPNILCTQFLAKSPNQTYNKVEGITVNTYGVLHIYSDNFNTADVSLWRAHLQANPMTVVYELAEPIETELPQTDIESIKNLHSYKPNTVVMNDADAEMNVSYVADCKLYIDQKFETLAKAIVNQ